MSRTRTFRDAVAEYFKTRPNVWVDAVCLEFIGGRQAWRSRVSDCRTELGMVIENRQRRPGRIDGRVCGPVISEYCYRPAVVQPDPQPHDLNAAWTLR